MTLSLGNSFFDTRDLLFDDKKRDFDDSTTDFLRVTFNDSDETLLFRFFFSPLDYKRN